jgi:hypothetical protein
VLADEHKKHAQLLQQHAKVDALEEQGWAEEWCWALAQEHKKRAELVQKHVSAAFLEEMARKEEAFAALQEVDKRRAGLTQAHVSTAALEEMAAKEEGEAAKTMVWRYFPAADQREAAKRRLAVGQLVEEDIATAALEEETAREEEVREAIPKVTPKTAGGEDRFPRLVETLGSSLRDLRTKHPLPIIGLKV